MNSKSLVTIQKLHKAGAVIAKIIAIFCLVGIGFSLVGGIVLAVLPDTITVGAETVDLNAIILEHAEQSKISLVIMLFSAVITMAAGCFLAKTAEKTFERELEDGTPFTHEGADRMKKLALTVIIVNIAAAIVVALFVSILTLIFHEVDTIEFDNGITLTTGIALLILSVIYRYGADVRAEAEKTAPDAGISEPAETENTEEN